MTPRPASEWLRELDAERMNRMAAVSPEYAREWYGEKVRTLFPLIADVVEAAEMLTVEGKELLAPEYPSTLKSYRAAHTALAALREALEEKA